MHCLRDNGRTVPQLVLGWVPTGAMQKLFENAGAHPEEERVAER